MRVVTLVDLLAGLIALPTILVDVHAVLMLPKGGSGSTHPFARLFRWLDARTGMHMATASYLALDYLIVRLGGEVATSSLALAGKVAIIGLLACGALALMYPVLAIYNALAWLFWRNPPLDLDKRVYFPRSALLEDPRTFEALRRELEAVMAEDGATPPITDIYQNITIIDVDEAAAPKGPEAAGKGWRSFFVRVAGRDIEANLARLPALAAVLRQTPEVYNVLFSILDPGHGIVPHRGYFKGFLRYHLGVIVPSPEKAWLICGGERYHWSEGAGVVFDDMFVHSVENHCRSPRVVLFVDIRRRMNPVSRLVTDAICWLVTRHPYQRGVRERAEAR